MPSWICLAYQKSDWVTLVTVYQNLLKGKIVGTIDLFLQQKKENNGQWQEAQARQN